MIARRMLMAGGAAEFTISASVRSPDIRALAIAAGWQPHQRIICKVSPGVLIASLVVQGLPHDALTLVINGASVGGIVNGGIGLTVIGQRIRVDNQGAVFGGGGIGGVGGGATATQRGGGAINANGGGGGTGAGLSSSGPVSMVGSSQGAAGQKVTWSGTVFAGDTRVYANGGAGGAGGALGVAGVGGGFGVWGGTGSGAGYPPGAVGQPGAAVSGNSLITWISLGSITGARVG